MKALFLIASVALTACASAVADPGTAPPSKLTALSPDAATLLAAHNAARATYCAAPLQWSPKIAAVAQRWADHLAANNCSFGHSQTNYGENLAAGTIGYVDAKAAVAMWSDEAKLYDFRHQGFSMTTGHFTQLVWKGTTEVGCGTSQCGGNQIWVCNYDPAGNVEGEYESNVSPPGCQRK